MTDEMRIEEQLDALYYRWCDREEEELNQDYYFSRDYWISFEDTDRATAEDIAVEIMKQAKVEDIEIQDVTVEDDLMVVRIRIWNYGRGTDGWEASEETKKTIDRILRQDARIYDYDSEFTEAEAA